MGVEHLLGTVKQSGEGKQGRDKRRGKKTGENIATKYELRCKNI